MGDFHYPFSASSAKRWLNCPTSVRLAANLPKQPSSVYAAEGTLAHEVCETMLKVHKIDLLPDGATDEMIEGAQLYLSEIDKVIDGSEYHIEDRLEVVKDLCGGTADFWFFDEDFDVLNVIDYKYGKGIEVFPDEPQTGIYALGAIKKIGHIPKVVRTTIVQPRLFIQAARVKTHVWSKESLTELQLQIESAIVLSNTAPTCAGDWCRFCPVTTCEAKGKFLTQQVCLDFPAEQKSPSFPPALMMTMDQRKAVLRYKKQIEKWMDDVAEFCVNEAEGGVVYEGFQLKPGRTTRKWKSDAAAMECLQDLGLRTGEIFTEEVISVAKAEKIVGKEKAKAFAPFLETSQGSFSLVPSKNDFDD